MSTTANKKELIDFLWEWGVPQGNWSQLLIAKIINTQAPLEQPERQNIFNYYLQDIGFILDPPLPPLKISKPNYTPSSKKISLRKISDVKGVNRLAEKQEMQFSTNITVIYGDNGTGKTGYSRILKSIGFSFDRDDRILSNVLERQIEQTARIDFSTEGTDYYYNWDGKHTTDELSSISVFNSNCVHFSLSTGRELLVSPQGFYLFKLVKDELAHLSEMHRNYYSQYPTSLAWKEFLHPNTPQSVYINALSSNSDLQKFKELSLFSEQNQIDLTQNVNDLKGLNKAALSTQFTQKNQIITELNSVITTIQHIQANLTKSDWDSIIEYDKALKLLKEKTKLGISELAEKHGLESFDSKEFVNFLKSADSYIKLLDKDNYPNNQDDSCIYCKQNFHSKEAINLVDAYGKILNDQTQQDIDHYLDLKTKIIDKVNLVNDNIVFHQPAFNAEENGNIIQPKEIEDFNKIVKSFKENILNDTVDPNLSFDINYLLYINFFTLKRDKVVNERNIIKERLDNLSLAETKLNTEIAELKDRKLLSEHTKEVSSCVNNLRAHKILNDNRNRFSTDSLSRKTTEARTELVAQDFQEKFQQELKRFRKAHLAINMSFYTDRGGSRINQNISSYNINDVLSEGEQKAIALAEFLTELQMDSTVAPVVFDDPVNSLDHHIIEDTARRLIELSKERQVVIFTHSILLFNSLYAMSESSYPLYNDVDFKFYNVTSQFGKTGVLSEGGEINKITEPIKKLNVLIQNAGKDDRKEEDLTKEGYGLLRTALELLITDEILQRTIRRYRKNVVMSGFPKINGQLIEKHKEALNEIFERSSSFIVGHSNPEPISSIPLFEDLKSDFEQFKMIRAEFSGAN